MDYLFFVVLRNHDAPRNCRGSQVIWLQFWDRFPAHSNASVNRNEITLSGNRLGLFGSTSWYWNASSSKLSAVKDSKPRRFGKRYPTNASNKVKLSSPYASGGGTNGS